MLLSVACAPRGDPPPSEPQAPAAEAQGVRWSMPLAEPGATLEVAAESASADAAFLSWRLDRASVALSRDGRTAARLEAASAEYDLAAGVVALAGPVTGRWGETILSAQSLRLDLAQTAWAAEGEVRVVTGAVAAVAKRASGRLDGAGALSLEEATVRLGEGAGGTR
ncbi:MAG: hypothetical protein C4523_16660 [Myxococcales bacterium]|nr:MAG: hypothetical protein C4523_16660 [Myxococcales bacterium]